MFAMDGKTVLILVLAVIVMAQYFDGRKRMKESDPVARRLDFIQEVEPEPRNIDEYLERRRRTRNAA